MFLYAPFTLCPSTQAPYTSSPRERYFDALARLRAAEASYLSLKAIEHEEEALTHRLRELQLRKQENQLRTLVEYLSGDACRTHGWNDFSPYQENDSCMINLAEHQASRAGHDCYCCDSLTSSMYPCKYCSDASIADLHLVRSSSPAVFLNKIEGPECNVDSSPRLKPWISSLIDNMHHSTLLAGSQTRTPTLSFSRRRRRARSLRRRHPCMLHHAFNRRYHSLQDNEQQKKPRYIVPLWQALSIPKPNPDEITAGDELVQEFPKLFDIPTTNGPRTDEPMQCTLGIVPFHAETPECNRVDVSNAPLEPDTEIASAPEGDAQAVSSVPAELVPSEGELDMPVPTASTIPSTNPSTVDSPTSTEITSSFDKIRTIEATFNALKENFTLPAELDFLPSTPSTPSASSISTSDSDTESTSATDHLTYSRLNRSVRSYEQALTVLLEQLDGVESLGDADVRKSRKDVVRRIELALEELEREVDGRWRIRVLEPPLVKGKVGDEVESNDFVPGLGLDVNYSEGERQDDTQKQNKSQDCADLISGPMPEIIEKDDSSTLVTTVKDDVSAPILTSPVHGNNLIQETSQDHLETSDVSPVANFPPTADHTIDPVKATDSIPSPVLIAPTTNSFPGDAEPGFSISSTSSALESAPIVPSNADAIVCDHECTMLDAVPPKSAVEIPTPSLLESSSTTNENTGLITVQGADVESEGFLLTSRGSDESVSEHPIVRDSDEDWIEVDV